MIYKPTDLSPSAQTFDVMDTPIFFECKVDTSNVQASGFTIEILDSENNVVFSSIPKGKQLDIKYITIIDDLREYVHTYFPEYETGYSLLNTGYNGSYLKFPFSVAKDSISTNTAKINQIYYEKQSDESSVSSLFYAGGYNENGDSRYGEPVSIYNGKEYKWSITLYQLENVGTNKNPVWILPENPLMFDMPMTTGTVLGSNNKRIQSALSEEIYGDYFIQPLKIEGLNYTTGGEDSWTYSGSITQVGNRVAVKSYDMSFGYIYPVEGDNGFQTGTIENDTSNAFRIYKNGNDPKNLTAYQMVNFVANKALDEVISTKWTVDGRVLEDGVYGYERGDIVLYNNNVYQCEKGYNSSSVSHDPGKNDAYWDVMSDTVELWVDGENLVYCKQNSSIYKRSNKIPCIYPELTSNNISGFDSSIIYYVDDVTKDTNTTKYYKCIRKTTIGIAITNTEYWEETTSSPYWSKKTDESVSEYVQSTIYDVDSFVKNGEKYYECIKKTTTDIEITNTEYWKEINIFNEYKNYSIDNVVGYNNNIYSCIKKIDQKPINGSAYWDLISYKNISYKADDIVGYVDKLYKCKKGYNVDDPIFNTKPSLYGYNQSPSTGDNKSMYWSIYNGQVWEWNESLANQGESYGTFTYYSPTNPNGIYALPDDIFPKTIIGGERIVLNSQLTKASIDNGEYLGSPHNGIYTIAISSQRSYEEYNTSSTYKYGDMVLYEGSIYCCTGSVQGIEPGTSDNWSRYWIGTQSSYNAESYDNDRIYKKDDVIQIFTGKDENGNDEYSYYTCLGTVLGQAPSSADSTYWVKNERNGYRVTIRFNRAPDADSWGELMTKIVYVSDGNIFRGKNIQIKTPNDDGTIDTSNRYGVINQTPFKFIEEEPVEIYNYTFNEYDNSKLYKVGDIVLHNNIKYICVKNTETGVDISDTEYWEDRNNDLINTIGLIFYNNPLTESNKNGILYIRYFEGIQKGMMLQKLSNDNKYQYFIIDDVGTNGGMYLKYHEVKEFDTYKPYTTSNTIANANPTILTADTTWDIDETKYQIKTYFRESDENAFYFYSRPIVDIQFENTAGVNFVTGRTPYVAAAIWEAGRTYHKGDYVYVNSDTRKYFLCLSESGVTSDIAPSITDANWELLTTGINVYENNVNYKKDTIVSYVDVLSKKYNIKTDSFNPSTTYNIGDVVKTIKNNSIYYYICIKKTSVGIEISNGEYWKQLNAEINIDCVKFLKTYGDVKKYNFYFEDNKWMCTNTNEEVNISDIGVSFSFNEAYTPRNMDSFSVNVSYYIALTNISQSAAPVAPEGKNLGIFWETYVGTLYKEDRGFDYSLYNNLKAYKAGDIVFDQGIYYIVSKDIKSETPIDNTNLWGLFTDINDGIVYPYEYFGFYEGKYYQCVNEGGSSGFISSNWKLVTDVSGDEQYRDGLRVNTDGSLYTDFISDEVYTVGRTVFYSGLKYQMRILPFNKNTDYDSGEYVMTGEQDNPKYYLCTNKVTGLDKEDPSGDSTHWREVDIVNTAPLLENTQYYERYNSWKSTKLYDEGNIVLYNNKYYVYINDNRNKKNMYRTELSYNVGDIAKIQDNDKVYRWKYCKIANPQGQLLLSNWTDIVPDNTDGIYNSKEFWTEYYGFLYVGNYSENTHTIGGNVGSYVNYCYNNVVYYNNQYYIYQNPNLDGVSSILFRINEYPIINIEGMTDEEINNIKINTSLERLNNNIQKYKAGEPGYNIGDIVLYDNKYYICYKATTTDHFSPANRNYWALYPWQIFVTEISERTVVCSGEYNQQQYIQWKSAQWFLYDATGENILDKSDVIYDGNLTYTFHGIDGREKGTQGDVIFIIRLVLETRTGYRLTIDKKIKAVYKIEEINSQGLIDAYFDCDTMSVVTVITKESGFIIPTLEGDGTVVTYAEGNFDGEMTVDGEVDYAKVLYSLESASAVASASDIISDSERFELQSSQKIDTDYFSGYITRIQTAVDSSDDIEWKMQGDFGIFIPEILQEEQSASLDDFNKNKILKLNPERNMLYWEAKDVNNGSYYMGPVEIREKNKDGNKISENGILTDVYNNRLYETASNYQPKNFVKIYGVTLEKDNKQNKYPNTNYLPITYATYFKDGSFNVGTVNKYNAETPYNVYDTKTFTLTKPITEMNIKRIQSPLVSRNSFLIDANKNANKFDVTGFDVKGNDSDTSKLKTKVYFAEAVPTLISDYTYSETYGIPEGLRYESSGGADEVPVTYYRQKNVINDFSEVWKEADNGETEFASWKDGEYITNGSSLQGDVLGSISINDGAPSTINIPGSGDEAEFSGTMLFLQERIVNIVSERSYLNGKEFIINADLVMDGNGGLTPYPGDTDKVESVVVYTDSDS